MKKNISDLDNSTLAPKQQSLVSDMTDTISAIQEQKTSHFSGICILSYNADFDLKNRCVHLRPNVTIPKKLALGTPAFIEYLLEIACVESSLHDGFVLVDDEGKLSRISQFVQVSIDPKLKPHNEYGTRYYSSLLATQISGIELAGNVSCSGTGMIFLNGNVYKV